MVQEIRKVDELGSVVCEDVSLEVGSAVAKDLMETANSLQDKNCCGLCANQIGQPANVIVVRVTVKEDGTPVWLPMINPRVVALGGKAYTAEEINFSLDKPVSAKRYPVASVRFMTVAGKVVTEVYRGEVAQIIQHELNMIRGVFSKK